MISRPASGCSTSSRRGRAPSGWSTAPESCADGFPAPRRPRSPAPLAPGASSPAPSPSGAEARENSLLESAEIGHKISKKAYARKEPALRNALLNAQYDLFQANRGPVLIILSGVHAGGRGETANKLTEWMDPRHIRVVAFGPRTPEEAQRPPAWRYWQALPPKGKIGIFLNAWYTEAVQARVRDRVDDDDFHSHIQ